MKHQLIYLALFLVPAAKAQVGIGTGTPNASAQLDIVSANKGLLMPRVTTTSNVTAPAQGLMVYQLNSPSGFYYFDGTAWQTLGNWTVNGNGGLAANAFIGTTDARPFTVKVNNVRSGFIDPTSNTAFWGYEAGFALTTGNFNTALGMQALRNNNSGSNNVAVGFAALISNRINTDNTALGFQALSTCQGNGNTAVGSNALLYITSGSNNTAVGFGSGTPSSTTAVSNTTTIGYGATTTSSDAVVIGNAAVSSIKGAVNFTTFSDIRIKKDVEEETHGLDFILALLPITYHLDVRKMNHFTYGSRADSLFPAARWQSSFNRKEQIRYSGFSAQQVESVARSIDYDFGGVRKPENEQDLYTLDYAQFVVPLVKAVQEQQALIRNLELEAGKAKRSAAERENENQVLRKEVQALSLRVNELFAKMEKSRPERAASF
jgi:trimeric autotransporter adhesin